MDRLQEIEVKHNRLRELLIRHHAEGIWLQRTRNIAWFTAGADASIPADSEIGAYSVLATADKRVIYSNNIEITRLRAEENFESLGFSFHEFPWHRAENPAGTHLLVDTSSLVEQDMQQLRLVLMESEQERYRALGQDTAAALNDAIRAVRPGDTEFEIAARLDAACRARGGLAVVNLVATDERISKFRHPLATSKKLEKYAMVVVCMRRGGLVVSGTRLAHIGKLPSEIVEKSHKCAAIDAAIMVATKPGRALSEVFADLQAAYATQGEGEQWQHHHQGGPAGYNAREWIVSPGDARPVQTNVAFAWNPSVVGCKSEDTILVGENGFEILSAASGDWPMIEVNIDGQIVKRPGILEI
jgi:Xaa-Pro aminopeptidase